MNRILYLVILIIGIISCSNDMKEIDDFFSEGVNANVEKGTNITIIYSDSAQVKIRISAPEMERYNKLPNTKDVFPKGVLLEFMKDNNHVESWLKADYAIRESRTKKITARGNVVFYNARNEKLETPELIFDEKDRVVYTDKLVRITQAEKGDTTYGFGFKANQSFSVFEIRKKVQGKVNVTDLVAEFK